MTAATRGATLRTAVWLVIATVVAGVLVVVDAYDWKTAVTAVVWGAMCTWFGYKAGHKDALR